MMPIRNGVRMGWQFCFIFVIMTNVLWAQEAGFVYNSKGKRDPFIRISVSTQTMSQDPDLQNEIGFDQVVLEGIVWDDLEPLAIINGSILAVGQTISGFMLDTIESDKIVLRKNGELHIIELVEERR